MNPILKATFWMLGAITCFTAMAVAGREVSLDHDTFEIMLYRSVVGVLIVSAGLTLTRRWGEIGPQKIGLHLVRNIAHFTGQNLWFFAVGAIPLAQVFALEFTGPLWVLLLSPLFLGERITRVRALAAAIGFVGILVVTRPFSATLSPGVIAAACAAIGFAGSAVFTRKLTRTQSLGNILFFMTLIQAVFGLVMAGIDGQIALPTASSLPWLALISVAALAAHFCLTSALKLAPATVVMPIDFVRLPLAGLIGWMVYAEQLELAVVLGAGLILVGNWVNIRASVREAREAALA